MAKVEVLFAAGAMPASTVATLGRLFSLHQLDREKPLPAELAGSIRGFARSGHFAIGSRIIESLPRLEIIANFGVGYEGIDLEAAAARGIVVTNCPDVLTEEVADAALGLLLMTVRELSAAERFLRAGAWSSGRYRLTSTLRDRTVGIVGLGRIGSALARRLDAMRVPVVYHNRRPRMDVAYRYYADLMEMAKEVDTLIIMLPGGSGTAGLVDRAVLEALGRRGILINMGRGTIVDEAALIASLGDGTIQAAGLDVFAHEPNVPMALLALPNVVLLPHIGSGSTYTRDAMGQLLVDNLVSWFEKGRPVTPVPETPVPSPSTRRRP